jgi:hypothetical protein
MWDTWKATQKVYNGFENCWDCCSLFADGPGETELDSDDDHEDIYLTVNPQPPPTAPDQTTPSIQSVGQSAPNTSSMSVCDQQTMSSTQRSAPNTMSHHDQQTTVEQLAPNTCMSRQGSGNNPSSR